MSILQDFRRAKSVAEAMDMVREGPGRGGFIAGGTSLGTAQMVPYDYLVDITAIGLSQIRVADGLVHIGATATIQQLASCSLVQRPELEFLGQAARSVATRQIRNMATVGGDLISGYPVADLPAAFLVLDAQLRLVGAEWEQLSLQDFFDSQGFGALKGGLVTEITFPLPPPENRGVFVKYARTQNDVAMLDLACLARLKGGQFEEVRVGLGSTVPRPMRLLAVEEFLVGQSAEDGVLAQAAEMATEGLSILDNIRGSRAYRKEMIQVLLRRALLACAQRGGGNR
jgi:CO/xanthine dehydrogenase FAD-binding subunit